MWFILNKKNLLNKLTHIINIHEQFLNKLKKLNTHIFPSSLSIQFYLFVVSNMYPPIRQTCLKHG